MSTTAHERARASSSVPLALVWLSLVLGVAGLVVSGYLTYEHYTASTSLACPDTGRISCARVTSSSYSELAGVPVATLGTLYFVAFLPLLTPIAWHATQSWVPVARVLTSGLGVAMTLYLMWAEFYGVGAICLWCTAVHGITFLLFATIVFAEAMRDSDPSWRSDLGGPEAQRVGDDADRGQRHGRGRDDG